MHVEAMTPEKLIGMTADELDKLTEKELNEYFQKYFPVTRPELAAKVTTQRQSSGIRPSQPLLPKIVLTEKQKQALAIMASNGEDISFINELNKKRK